MSNTDGEAANPKHIQHKWSPENFETLERVKKAKDEQYNLSWKELLVLAAICCEEGDEQIIDKRVGAAQRALE